MNKKPISTAALSEERVWDKFVIFFHWTLVIAFATSYITGENEWMTVHEYSGYYISLLIISRIIWGLVGSKHAKFKDFLFSPTTILRYAKDFIRLKPKQYTGHNPLGGLMVVALLVMLVINTVSGLLLLGGSEFEGPLAFIGEHLSDNQLDAIEEIHESASSLTLLMVFVHVAGVVIDMLLHRHNLVKSMLTGRKKMKIN